MSEEKFLKGIIGGFIGSLVGVFAILFFYKLLQIKKNKQKNSHFLTKFYCKKMSF